MDYQTAQAQKTATKHGAKTPLLSFREREEMVNLGLDLFKINPRMYELYMQHLDCMTDCLEDAKRELAKARSTNGVLLMVWMVGFVSGAILGQLV